MRDAPDDQTKILGVDDLDANVLLIEQIRSGARYVCVVFTLNLRGIACPRRQIVDNVPT